MNIQQIAEILAMIVGTITIAVVGTVLWKQKSLGGGGAAFSFVGALLIGTPIWSEATVSFAGAKAEFKRLQEDVQVISESAATVSNQVQNLSEAVATANHGVVELTDSLASQNAVPRATVQRVRKNVERAPQVDQDAIEAATRNLDIVRMRTPGTLQRTERIVE